MNETAYYLILDCLVGKKEDAKYYLFREDKWVPDTGYVIMDRLMGYDASEPDDSPYAITVHCLGADTGVNIAYFDEGDEYFSVACHIGNNDAGLTENELSAFLRTAIRSGQDLLSPEIYQRNYNYVYCRQNNVEPNINQ